MMQHGWLQTDLPASLLKWQVAMLQEAYASRQDPAVHAQRQATLSHVQQAIAATVGGGGSSSGGAAAPQVNGWRAPVPLPPRNGHPGCAMRGAPLPSGTPPLQPPGGADHGPRNHPFSVLNGLEGSMAALNMAAPPPAPRNGAGRGGSRGGSSGDAPPPANGAAWNGSDSGGANCAERNGFLPAHAPWLH